MTLSIGTVISGTLRDQDLIPAFLEELRTLDEDAARDIREEYLGDMSLPSDDNQWWETDIPRNMLSDINDALSELAPPYVRFGAHEGDGADFGWWPDIEAMEHDVEDGQLLKVSDLSEVPDCYNGASAVMLVNDHGNITLYEPVVEYRERWSCV